MASQRNYRKSVILPKAPMVKKVKAFCIKDTQCVNNDK